MGVLRREIAMKAAEHRRIFSTSILFVVPEAGVVGITFIADVAGVDQT